MIQPNQLQNRHMENGGSPVRMLGSTQFFGCLWGYYGIISTESHQYTYVVEKGAEVRGEYVYYLQYRK
jgi:hypothetical protein